MKVRFAAPMLVFGLLVLALAGCGGWPLREEDAGTGQRAKPALSVEAEQALARAEAEVAAARQAFTLWTSAVAALERARAAAGRGDSDIVIREAGIVLQLCTLSRAQAGYPPTDMP